MLTPKPSPVPPAKIRVDNLHYDLTEEDINVSLTRNVSTLSELIHFRICLRGLHQS
jgi:hypothetical protein